MLIDRRAGLDTIANSTNAAREMRHVGRGQYLYEQRR